MTFVGICQSPIILRFIVSVGHERRGFRPLAPVFLDVRAKVFRGNTTAIVPTIIGRIRRCDLCMLRCDRHGDPRNRATAMVAKKVCAVAAIAIDTWASNY